MKSSLTVAFILFLTSIISIAQTNQEDIIRDANVSIEVADYAKSRINLLKMIEKRGGYIYDEKESKFTTKITNDIIIRIPDKNYDLLITDISAEASTVNTKNAKLIDAAKELNDLYERRKLKEQVKLKYKGLLEEAKTTGEIRQLEEKIEGVNVAIEQLYTKIKLLEEKGFSTLHLTFYQSFDIYIPPAENDDINLSIDRMERLVKIAAIILVVLVLIGVVAYLWYKEMRRKKRRKKRSSRSYGSTSGAESQA